MAGKKVAKRKANGGLPVSVQAEMDKELDALADKIGSAGGDNISVKGKIFTFPDGHQEEGPFGFVIVNFISANLWWEEVYDEKNPTPPDCWAFGLNPKKMVASKNSTELQNDESCNDCPQNVFGSGVGDSKACKNTRLLGVVAGDSDDDEDPILKLSVSPTGLRNWDGYVNTLKAKGILPIQVITEIDFDANQTYPKLIFKAVGPNPNAELHWGRRVEAQELLLVEPDPSAYSERTPARGGRKTTKKTAKKTTKKKGGRSAGSHRV